MKDKPIVIIGAGISGLTLCLVLLKNGIPVILFEKEKEINQPGAGINISPNGNSILFNLGLKEKIISLASKPISLELRTHKKGIIVAKQNLNNSSERFYNYPFLQMQRNDLIDTLKSAINKINPNIIFTDYLFENFSEKNGSILVHFNNQKSVEGSLMVGCDGINSSVRKIMLPTSENKFSGIIAWRGLVDMKKLSSQTQKLSTTIWMGKNSHFVHYPIKKHKVLNFIGTLRNRNWLDESWHKVGSKKELQNDFKGWNKTVEEIVKNIEIPYKWGLFERESLPNWISSRAVIIGDASHPMSPSYGQGANSAMEDAIVLYRSIITFKGDPYSALKKFQKNRKKRSHNLQRASKFNTKLFHLKNPILRALVYSGLYSISRLIPFILIKSRWVYKYNAFNVRLK